VPARSSHLELDELRRRDLRRGGHVRLHDLRDGSGSSGLDFPGLILRVVAGADQRTGLHVPESVLLLAHALPLRKLGGRYYEPPSDLEALREPLDLLGPLSNLPGYTPPVEEAEKAKPGKRSRRDGDVPPPIVDFEALLVPDAPDMLGMVVSQLAYHDIVNVTLLGTNLWYSEELLQVAGEFVQGAVFPADFYPASQAPQIRRFVAAFEAVYGRQPGFIEAIAYDSARLLLKILENPDIRLRAGIRHALHAGSGAPGITGKVIFDGRGEPVKDLVLLQIDGAGVVEIDPSQPPPIRHEATNLPPPPR